MSLARWGGWFVRAGQLAAVVVGVLAAQVASSVRADEVTVRVGSEPAHPVSPRLIGAFFEDINFGADGGLNAELVKNGSFEAPKRMLGWAPLGEGAELESEAPVSAANPTFLRFASPDGDAPRGVVNEGFRGMGVRSGEVYRLELKARSTAGATGRLVAKLVAPSGDVLVRAAIDAEGSAWRTHRVELTPSRTEARAQLELWASGARVVDVDSVSLCTTDTWKGRDGGLRRDLVQLLADMKPAFFRFPGGCIVEGSELKYRYDWKSTIGPRDERRMIKNRWMDEFAHRPAPDYFQSFDIGFYEYFLLSEDLGAEPLPIINCGMACQFNTGELVPLEELQPYIQDALDLIEFANGPVDSEWGGRRAEMGHPEPFGMELLGVGNEQWGPEYFERYRVFAEVLEREHPEIELISTSGPFPSGERFDFAWPLLRQLNVPIVDEHCYATPDWFLREAHRYDNYDRNGPQAFMGEYAAQSVKLVSIRNRNNLRCAISEAAFLSGVERNSDVVTMSAYAPLSAHEDAWQWRPNLLWFDNLKSYGTPSYYVQKLYSLHRGDHVLATEVDDPRPEEPLGGRFGVGSHQASVEFRNLSVSADDAFIVHEGEEWEQADGVIRYKSRRGGSRALVGKPAVGDAVFECQARKLEGREGFAIFLRYGEGGSRIEWNIGGWGNQRHGLIDQQATHSTTPRFVTDAPGSIEQGRWYDLRVETEGSRVRCYVDGELVHDVDIPAPKIDRLFATASVVEGSGERIVKLVNATDESTSVRLELAGLRDGPHTCQQVQLTGDPEAENSIDSPTNVSPVESEVKLQGANPVIETPPHSFTILRIAS